MGNTLVQQYNLYTPVQASINNDIKIVQIRADLV